MISIGLASPDNLQGLWQHRAKTHFDHLVIAHTVPVVASAIVNADPRVIAEAVAAHVLKPRFREGRSSFCYEDHTDRGAGYDPHLEGCREELLVECCDDSANLEDGIVCYVDPV